MHFHIIRFSADTGKPTVIALSEWQELVNNDPTLYWLPSQVVQPTEKNAAVYFSDHQDTQGMDWQLNSSGQFRFQNKSLLPDHPYIQKIFEVANILEAEVIEQADSSGQCQEGTKAKSASVLSDATSSPATATKVSWNSAYDFPVMDLKAQRPQNMHRIKKQIRENSAVTCLHLYSSDLFLGSALQGDIVAPVPKNDSDQHYQIKNIWLELIAIRDAFYTFCVQTTFMVQLPDMVLFYKSGSRIEIDKTAIRFA